MRRSHSELLIRWTVGDVSAYGFEALRLSIWGARKIFGAAAKYVVGVNTVPISVARRLTGDTPPEVTWRDVTAELPQFLFRYLDGGMSEGVAWKFAPARFFPDGYELSLDNDCILWEMPEAIRRWLDGSHQNTSLIAADVKSCFGQFAAKCGTEPRNSGIRGLPPGFPFEQQIADLLREHPVKLVSELDEQGLQVAALLMVGPPLVVRVDEVSICSPFPPHLPWLGSCGAHFVGLNARHLPWSLNGKPAVSYIQEHWHKHRGEVYKRVSVDPPRTDDQ